VHLHTTLVAGPQWQVESAPVIIMRDIGLRRADKLLLHGASATVQNGQRVALTGANGSGKSSLFALLLGELGADSGEIEGLGGMRLAHMAQEVSRTEVAAADYVLEGDAEVAELLHALRAAESAGDFDTAASLHAALQDCDGYTADSRARRLLDGLGFAAGDAERPVADFSGGWRIRLNLARALMTPSDLLLLDEPTNHLDLDASLWLQRWLLDYPGTLLLISHDRDFIDATCQRVLHIEGQQLQSYRGGYSDFEHQRAERLANQQALFERQQRRIGEIEDFVRRFRYKATKARQAQSRLKELERMQQVAAAHVDSPFSFSFPPAPPLNDPALQLAQATLGYAGHPVLEKVELRLAADARIGLLGRNGAGKSTLLKSLVGRLPLLGGHHQASPNCRIGYYDQQQLEVLDLEASPALHLQRLRPEAREQEILNFLGGFDFRGERATQRIAPFSGGEKARLALAMVVWQQPNLLVLDEPTNHLDLEMREALVLALQGFAGAVLLVTHDRHLLRNSVEELWLVAEGRVLPFDGDLDTYERTVVAGRAETATGAPPDTRPAQGDSPGSREATRGAVPAHSAGSGDSRQRRQQSAARREQQKPLQRTVRRLEQEMEQTQQSLSALRDTLADPALYTEAKGGQLEQLLREEAELRSRNETLEQQWLQAQEELEALQVSDDR